MDIPPPTTEKKKSKSFWNRILHLSRKSSIKEKPEDSFRRQSMQYSSLNTTKHESQSNGNLEESNNFTTLECSALMDVHRDAGILFLNKESVTNCFAPREENKHVQFVPTPLNKYYRVDIKSAPAKKDKDENKENMEQIKCLKPTRPILRLDKSKKINFQSSTEYNPSNSETRLVNVTYIDGPHVKTPSMPRTSTKLALVDRKNGSLPQLNVSTIIKYNSLPRQPKTTEVNIPSHDKLQMTSQSTEGKCLESLPVQQYRNVYPASDIERYRRSNRNLNSHRQSCYGVSDPSRIFEGKKVIQTQQHHSSQDTRSRLSLGGPLAYSSQMTSDSNCHSENSTKRIYFKQETQQNFKKFLKVSGPSRGPCSVRSLEQPIEMLHKHGCLIESNSNEFNRQQHHASTGNIPNKAINEIGLPLVSNKQNRYDLYEKSRSRSKSPHYIGLSETYTSNNSEAKRKENTLPSNKCLNKYLISESSNKTLPQKTYGNNYPSTIFDTKNKSNKQSSIITEKRKQEIMSAMQTQKRKKINKICKYNSKEYEDGFSSMADDECSFNCSCPSCILKVSRNYKRNGLKNLFSFNKNNKYFFTIEPDIQEGNELERLPENQTYEGPMAKAQPHLSSKLDSEHTIKRTWYGCNDILCQTPNNAKPTEKASNLIEELIKTPNKKITDNIYENITQIINSATKKKLTPQDVKRIFSTPICSPMKIGAMSKSLTKPPRVLFPDELNENQKKKNLTPMKNSDYFNDSIVLLQEIFQKLSLECKELLQPNASTGSGNQRSASNKASPRNKYVNNLVKNLKSAEISEADFANIIGGIAQNIFSETKARRKVKHQSYFTSLPDLQKASLAEKAISVANSLQDLYNIKIKNTKLAVTIPATTSTQANEMKTESTLSGDSTLFNRQLPDGWSRTPTTEESNLNDDVSSTKLSSNSTDDSKYSETELQLLENAIRLGMGLTPVDRIKKTPMYAASPTKATKYRSRDVLSGKGKLKLKIYYNSGLVTVYVMKAAKLSWTNSRDLNSYVKITMIPDESKRVHWRTTVQKAQKNPVYNQKFSFELLAEDETKRLVFSVWHRDYDKQRSELIGCMSFSVSHVMHNTHNVDGWYRLLREKFGTQKHFAAHTYKTSSPMDLLK